MEKMNEKDPVILRAGNSMIVSYSYSGNTNRVAMGIRAVTGAPSCEIFPWQPYPMSFPELLEQVKKEINSKYRPRLLPNFCSPRDYDIIFVGSPNWCGTIAPPLRSWLCKNNLSGKIILPFCSHCGGVPGNMQRDVAQLCPKSDVREVLSVINDGGEMLTERIERWLVKCGVRYGSDGK